MVGKPEIKPEHRFLLNMVGRILVSAGSEENDELERFFSVWKSSRGRGETLPGSLRVAREAGPRNLYRSAPLLSPRLFALASRWLKKLRPGAGSSVSQVRIGSLVSGMPFADLPANRQENLRDGAVQALREYLLDLESLESYGEGTRGEAVKALELALPGRSKQARHLRERIVETAAIRQTALVHGEEGTEKDLVLSLIHTISKPSGQWHRFLQGSGRRPSRELTAGSPLELCRWIEGILGSGFASTVVIDRIHTLSSAQQAYLHRLIELIRFKDSSLRPLVLLESNTDGRTLAEKNLLERDLFYSVRFSQVRVPPLRERPEDLEDWIRHLLPRLARVHGKRIESLAEEAGRALRAYPFPGNTLELTNILETAAARARGPRIELEDLPDLSDPGAAAGAALSGSAQKNGLPAVVDSARVERSSDRDGRLPLVRKIDLREAVDKNYPGIIHVPDSPFAEVLAKARSAGATDSTVLIFGETGTGKELVAKVVAGSGPRADKGLVEVNLSAMPESLFESELFGHTKGSFTGAIIDRLGIIQAVDGGSLFLDEIGDLPSQAQVKLLRFLQEGEVQRIGEKRPQKVNVRTIAATNADLRTLVADKAFRQDLYYRLSGIEISVPPLREHCQDIPYLIAHFTSKLKLDFRAIETAALDFLVNGYTYPGNVRELENIISNLSVIARGSVIRLEDLCRLEVFAQAGPPGEGSWEKGGPVEMVFERRPGAALANIIALGLTNQLPSQQWAESIILCCIQQGLSLESAIQELNQRLGRTEPHRLRELIGPLVYLFTLKTLENCKSDLLKNKKHLKDDHGLKGFRKLIIQEKSRAFVDYFNQRVDWKKDPDGVKIRLIRELFRSGLSVERIAEVFGLESKATISRYFLRTTSRKLSSTNN